VASALPHPKDTARSEISRLAEAQSRLAGVATVEHQRATLEVGAALSVDRADGG
jgi:hypothetical protein